MRIPGTSFVIDGPRSIAVLLLGAACASGGVAWGVQSSAAHDLRRAHELGQREVPEDDSPPPDLEDYRAILDTISEAVEIRRNIDDLLTNVEETVALFEDQRAQADEITAAALDELDAIARGLHSSVAAAETSDEKLSTLRTRLKRSAELAAAIARELEELDESLGPSVGGGP